MYDASGPFEMSTYTSSRLASRPLEWVVALLLSAVPAFSQTSTPEVAQSTGIRQRGKEATLLIIINGNHELHEFTLPECAGGLRWSLMIDTNRPELDEGESFAIGAT